MSADVPTVAIEACAARTAFGNLSSTWEALLAGASIMGLTVLAKETSLVLLGGAYAFFALTPKVRVRLSHLVFAAVAMLVTLVPLPVALALSKRTSTGQNYLLWQIFRRANHPVWFYGQVVPAAVGYAQESGIPYGLGLVKNSYVGRTFIQPSQTIRQLGIRLKLNPLRDVIRGKRLVVVDDSIVRGNTQRALIRMLREAGAV